MEIAAAFAIASAAVGAVGAIQQGNATAAAANYNAEVARENAKASREQTAADVEQKAREQRKHLGSVRANYGSSGLVFEGSAFDVFEDQMYDMELDKRLMTYKGEMRARGYDDDARLKKMEAKNATTAGYIGALSSITKAGASYYGGKAA